MPTNNSAADQTAYSDDNDEEDDAERGTTLGVLIPRVSIRWAAA